MNNDLHLPSILQVLAMVIMVDLNHTGLLSHYYCISCSVHCTVSINTDEHKNCPFSENLILVSTETKTCIKPAVQGLSTSPLTSCLAGLEFNTGLQAQGQ